MVGHRKRYECAFIKSELSAIDTGLICAYEAANVTYGSN